MSAIHGPHSSGSLDPLNHNFGAPSPPKSVGTIGDVIAVLVSSLSSVPSSDVNQMEQTIKNVFVALGSWNDAADGVSISHNLQVGIPINTFLSELQNTERLGDNQDTALLTSVTLYSNPTTTSQFVANLPQMFPDNPTTCMVIAQCILYAPQNPDPKTAELQQLLGVANDASFGDPPVIYSYSGQDAANMITIMSSLANTTDSNFYNLLTTFSNGNFSNLSSNTLNTLVQFATVLPTNWNNLPSCFSNLLKELNPNSDITQITSSVINLLDCWKSVGSPLGSNTPFNLLLNSNYTALLTPANTANFIQIVQALSKHNLINSFNPTLDSLLSAFGVNIIQLTNTETNTIVNLINSVFDHTPATYFPIVILILQNNLDDYNANNINEIISSIPKGYSISDAQTLIEFFQNNGLNINTLSSEDSTNIAAFIKNFPTNRPAADFLPILNLLGINSFKNKTPQIIENFDVLLNSFSSTTNISNFLPLIQDVLTATSIIFLSSNLTQNLASIIKAFGDASPSTAFISLLNDLDFFHPDTMYSMQLSPAQMFTITSLISSWVSAGSPSDPTEWLTQNPGGPTSWFYTTILDAQTNLSSTDMYNVCMSMKEEIDSLVASGKYFDSNAANELPLFDDAMTALLAAVQANDPSSLLAFAAAAAILNSFK